MLPEHIIYDELKRERSGEWQPEALRLPLYVPRYEAEETSEGVEEESQPRGVIIIDMNDGYAVVE